MRWQITRCLLLCYRCFRTQQHVTLHSLTLKQAKTTKMYRTPLVITDLMRLLTKVTLTFYTVIVTFPLDEDPSLNLVAWTTTPWTLPSNLALCVHPEFIYVTLQGMTIHYIAIEWFNSVYIKITAFLYSLRDSYCTNMCAENSTGKFYVMLESRIEEVFKDPAKYTIMRDRQLKGSALVGKKYVPLFPYFLHLKSAEPDAGAFRVAR